MFYKDQYGNVIDYSAEDMNQYSNTTNSNEVDYHPLTKENFSFDDLTFQLRRYKTWLIYGLIIFIILMVLWWWNNRRIKKSVASVFY